MSSPVRWLLVENTASAPDQAYYDYPRKLAREDGRLWHLDPPVGTAEEAIRRAEEELPDVILLDFGLPGPEGVDSREVGVACAEELSRVSPRSRLVILSNDAIDPGDFRDCAHVRRLSKAGVIGYITKDVRYPDAADVLIRAADNQWVFRPGTINELWRACLSSPHPCFDGPSSMTEQEHRVMVEATTGETPKTIGDRLSLQEGTVHAYLKKAGEKMDEWPGRTRLIAWALRNCPDAKARSSARLRS